MAQAPTPSGEEPDPSMDDILASIRRILDDDPAVHKPSDDVLMLDPSMMVEEPEKMGTEPDAQVPQPMVAKAPELVATEEMMHTASVNDDPLSPASMSVSRDAPSLSTLVAPEAAAAAASSVGTLMRTLAAERSAAIGRGGLTIEDLVREEIRPLLKQWLDTHLAPVVERLVRAEIERVVGRQAG